MKKTIKTVEGSTEKHRKKERKKKKRKKDAVERRRDTEKERSEKARSMPGRKREGEMRKKAVWEGKRGNTRPSHNQDINEETVEVPDFNPREMPLAERAELQVRFLAISLGPFSLVPI
jgi:hypothetical protein